MKRAIICILALVMLLSGISQPCLATTGTHAERVYLEDGSYYEITMSTSRNNRASDNCYGQKLYRYYDALDTLLWTVALSVEFVYDYGVSVNCVDATCDVYISDDDWSCTTNSVAKNGPLASCHVEMLRRFLLIPMETIPVDLLIHCDTFGNLS